MSAALTMVPDWLVGFWHRDYIKRADKDGNLGPPQSHVEVWYLQTPFAFLDVRRAPGTKTEALAFAGVTTFDGGTDNKDPLVKWHACLDLDPLLDSTERWQLVDKATPKPTEDEGFFARLEENLYRETDPGKTLEEQWARQHNGKKRFLAARRGTSLFVVVGDHFGYASQDSGENGSSPQFLAGLVQDWIIEISPSHLELEGSTFGLLGKQEEWQPLPGCTLELGSLDISYTKTL